MTNGRDILKIDLGLPTPAYRQIADGLRALLVDGTFKPGDRLRTVRELAVDLAVHHNTVAQAYRILADEGWLDLRRKRGVIVVERPASEPTEAAHSQFSQGLRELAARAAAAGLAPAEIQAKLAAFSSALTPNED